MLRLLSSTIRINPQSVKLWQMKKKFMLVLLSHLKLNRLKPHCDECLVKMEKALHLCHEICEREIPFT